MKRLKTIPTMLGIVLCCCASSAYGEFIFFDDETDWLAATVGPAQVLEDFESFSVDTPYGLGGLAVNGFTVRSIGVQSNSHFVDVVNIGTSGVDFTTKFLRSFADEDGLVQGGPEVSAQLDSFVGQHRALGFDFSGVGSSMVVEVVSNLGEEDGTFLNADDGFFGFVIDDPTEFLVRLFFHEPSNGAPNSGELFGIDNIRVANVSAASPTVPEPSSLLLFSFATATLLLRRRHCRLALPLRCTPVFSGDQK